MPVYKQFFPKVTFIAEVAASLPVTNAWPERGASALKNLKTRHRNRIQNDMLEAVLHVTVNCPNCNDKEGEEKTGEKKVAESETGAKKRQQCETGVQTEVVIFDHDEIRQENACCFEAQPG